MKMALIVFLIGVVLFLVGKTGLNRKPIDTSLVNRLAKEPAQRLLEESDPLAAPIYLKFEKQLYTLYPRAQYSIEGLIVSQHRSDSLFDLAHARSGDTLNSRDICTVWGRNLTAGVYRDVDFWSGDWTCYFQWTSPEVGASFKFDEISNTHVLAKDPVIRAKIDELEIGDEYKMSGRLVDYEQAFGGRRNSSLNRTDTGNGACEVMYVESIEVLRSHNELFKKLKLFGFWTALLALVAAIGLMGRSIFFARRSAALLALLFLGSLGMPRLANARICDASTEYCGDWGGNSSSSTSSTSRGGKIRINPAVIPIAKGFGAEFLFFDGSVDFALVKGLGRIGAAISPSNSDETFFGPPGFEYWGDFYQRKLAHHKYPNQKITLATAIGLIDNRASGMKKFTLNLGVMGKYNKISGAVFPGGGISGVAGPFTFGYSRYGDQTLVTTPELSPIQPAVTDTYTYNVETYSFGAFIESLAVDYSFLRVLGETASTRSSASVITATLLFKKSLLTAAMRTDKLATGMPSFNYGTGQMDYVDTKVEYFGGIQYAIANPLLVGVFYNYYLVRDISIGATIFF